MLHRINSGTKNRRPSAAVVLSAALAAAMLAGAGTRATAGDTFLYTAWEDTTFDVDEVLRRAEAALRESGFTRIKVDREAVAVFGQLDDYGGSIRAAPQKDIVFFITAGPTYARNAELNQRLQQDF